MQKIIIISISILFSFLISQGQEFSYKPGQQSLVFIKDETETQEGSGVIVSQSGDTVRILTAAHVVEGWTAKISLDRQAGWLDAKVEQKSTYYDLALLRILLPGFYWKPFRCVINYTAGDSTFIYSVPRNKQIIPVNGSGIIADLDAENIVAKLTGIVGGDSGTPLWCRNGLIGIIYTKSPVQARSIQLIKRLIQEDWHSLWQLTDTTLQRPLLVKEPPPDIDNEVVIQPNSIFVGGQCAGSASELIDGNLTTYWVCEKEGKSNLEIRFNGTTTIRKIKLYYPNSYSDDIPNGTLELLNVDKSFKLSRLMNSTVERDNNGVWYTFDLQAYYRTSGLSLTLKPKIESLYGHTEKIIPIKLFEIKIIGPKTTMP